MGRVPDKLPFAEWYATEYNLEDVAEAQERLSNTYQGIIMDGVHHGDCTLHSEPCIICLAEMLLTEYYEYVFPEKIKK